MSLANGSTRTATGTRTRIVDALEAVDGITAYPVVPGQATAGAAWPKWIQTLYAGHLCSLAQDTYDVLVTLPASYVATTVDQGDAFRDVVAPALLRLGRLEVAEPVQVTFNDKQTMPALRFRVVVQ
jgi:hypothetical protein